VRAAKTATRAMDRVLFITTSKDTFSIILNFNNGYRLEPDGINEMPENRHIFNEEEAFGQANS
ncbi:hypothetical protein MUP37_03825, partial [Candidatus Bathyarchaeota archaeon]|nr:hypothetical protein [Candidatus Bathyarchaeota archaeon]